MSITQETLKKFGLKDNEIAVYLQSIKQDELTPFQIAKITGIPRTTVYDVLMGLSLKGLVELEQSDGFTKQQTLVRAKNPSTLRDILQKRRKELVSLELDVIEILPDIKKDFHKEEAGADFKFYPGIDGAKELYLSYFDNETGDLNTPLYEWDLLMPMDAFGLDVINKDVQNLIKRRTRQKHIDKTIIPLNDWTKHVLTYQVGRHANYLENVEYRYIEDTNFDVYTQFGIRGDYVKVVCAKTDEVWGMRLKSKLFAQTLKAIFDQNWKIAKPITSEMVKNWGENPFLVEENKRIKRK